ncbi:carboxypeptidase regulatory-like domain-containing protein [candidate division WWE3 bacterium]|uniref:Carboxypeptidase regulatory-like domain-containing protein n=1 Tax=candidate division WWE3 bacterium TaxID=2053526 RepID=A0A955LGN2_UNCKA|nr:carboxypeptidase regulatory-like domain-containing protein [candidate division WWE3 bacterium]
MMENQDTAQTMKGLAVSKKNPTFIAMPQNSAHNRVQLLSNQRTNRHLSRVSVAPQVTPIWQQQTFTPSPEIQKRFGQQQPPESETITIQPDAPPKPAVPTAVKPPIAKQKVAPAAQPNTVAPDQTPQTAQVPQSQSAIPKADQPPIIQVNENAPAVSDTAPPSIQSEPAITKEKTIAESIEPEASIAIPEKEKKDSEMSELVQVVEDGPPQAQPEAGKSISDLLDELSTSVKKPTPKTETAPAVAQQEPPVQPEPNPVSSPEEPQQTVVDKSQQPSTTEQPEQSDDSSSLSSEALANSLSVLSDLRQQIHDQEEKLQSMREELPEIQRKKLEYLTEQKTKGALLKNVEHALLNSKQELDKLRHEPGASQELIKNLQEQLQKQQDTFNKLANEQKRLDKKAEELQQKLKEHEEAERTLGELEQQHTELKTADTTETPTSGDDGQTPELDPPIRQLINQTMAIDQNKTQTPEPTTVQPAAPAVAPTVQPQPAPTQPAASPAAEVQIKMPTITNEKNAINGVVTDTNKKLVTDAIVIIKNSEGRPLRALKTNQLGQYWITTALDNGKYSLETEKEGMTFDTIEVELTGKPVEPILIPASS